MKANLFIKQSLLIIGIMALLTISGNAQGILGKIKDRAKEEAKKAENMKPDVNIPNNNGNMPDIQNVGGGAKNIRWARFEVRTSWKEKNSSRTTYETRVYYSDIKSLSISPEESRKIEANAMQYFDEGIGNQLKARGIDVKYYDSDVSIYPLTTPYDSQTEAQEQMNKKLEADKSNEYAIYTFTWKYGSSPTGEETTQPKRVFSTKPAPSMENTPVAVQTPIKTDSKTSMASDNQIWGYALLHVRVKPKLGKEITRTYVSEVVSVSRADYNAFYNTDERFIKPRIWEYFAATVVAAAKERGETIEEPYDGSIQYKFNVEMTGNDVGKGANYKFMPKSTIEEPRQQEIGYAKQTPRPVFYFRWDTSGKNTSGDLAKERTRTGAELPN